MIYLDNNTFQQEIFIPRSSARNDASPEYATKTELENAIENEVIRADGKYATKTDLLPYATTGWVESQDFATKEWTEEQIASETARTEETYQKISEMSAYSTTIEVESMIDDAVSGKADSSAVTAQINEVKAEIEAEIPTKVSQLQNDLNFIDNTVNNLVNYYTKSETYTIEQVNALVAAIPHFQIVVVNRLPAVGDVSTVYLVRKQDPSTSDLYDEYIWVNNTWEFLGSATVDLSQYWTSAQTQSAITFALRDYRTESQIRGMINQSLSAYSTTQQVQTLINNAVSGKADTSAVTAYIAAATAATTGWVESQGYITGYTETDPVFMASAASGITSNDISNWNNKLDASALTPYYTSAQTDTAIANAVSGKADSSAVTEQISDAKEEIEAEIPTKLSDLQNDLNFVNSGDVKTQIEGYNYINSGQAQTQIDSSISSALTPYATTAFTESTYLKSSSLDDYYTKEDINTAIVQIEGHIASKADASALTQYYTSAQTDTAIANAVSGKVDTSTFEQAALYIEQEFINVGTALDGKVDTSAMTEYYTSAETETAIQNATSGFATEQYVDDAIEAIDIPTVPTNVSDFVNDAGYISSEDLIESGYTTQDYVDSALTETNNHIDNMEEMTATALLELKNTKADATALTEYAKSEHVAELEQVTSAALNDLNSNKADVDAFTAYTPTSGFATINGSAITEGGNIVIQGGGGSEYSAGTNISIDNYVISVTGITEMVEDAEDHIDNMEEMTAIALMDLKTNKADATALTEYAKSEHIGEVEQVTSVALNNLETNKVGSTDVHHMSVVTQAQYDAMAQGGTLDSSTFYIIL